MGGSIRPAIAHSKKPLRPTTLRAEIVGCRPQASRDWVKSFGQGRRGKTGGRTAAQGKRGRLTKIKKKPRVK